MTQDAVNPSVVECCIIRKFKLLKTEREVNCTTTYTVNTVRVTPLSLTKNFRDHGREKIKSFARVSLTKFLIDQIDKNVTRLPLL